MKLQEQFSATFMSVNTEGAVATPLPSQLAIVHVKDTLSLVEQTVVFDKSFFDPYYTQMKMVNEALRAGENPVADIETMGEVQAIVDGEIKSLVYARFVAPSNDLV
jgi:hypothetical protein